MNENLGILICISLEYVRNDPTNNMPALCQTMAGRRIGDRQAIILINRKYKDFVYGKC